MSGRRLRTVVCGSTFGQFYLAALARLDSHFEIVGVMGRGSTRSAECARRFGVPLYGDVGQLPAEVDLACVVVRSAVMGGGGTDLSVALLERGIHVIQEQPVHHEDLAACLRTARRHAVQFKLGNLYVHLPAVRRFIAAARTARSLQPALFIDAACSSQVSFPLVHILGEALETVRPWAMAPVAAGNEGPLQLLSGMLGGIPFTLRAHNEVDPDDPDNHIHLLHRIIVGFPGGSLSLTETHGPVTWNPRLHIPAAVKDRFDFSTAQSAHLSDSSTEILGPAQPLGYRHILARQWPAAIGRDLVAMHDEICSGGDGGRGDQRLLTLCRLWQEMTSSLGYPVLRPGRDHRPLEVSALRAAVAAFPCEPEETSLPVIERDGDVFGCTEPAEAIAGSVTADEVRTFVSRMDEAVLASMMLAFQEQGCLRDPDGEESEDEILARTRTAARHRGLIRRWLRILVARGLIGRQGNRLAGIAPLVAGDVAHCWDLVSQAWDGRLGSPAFGDYLRLNAARLPALMRDEQQAALLLFPEGRTELADAIYRDTITARYLNTAVAEAVRRICQDGRSRLRVAEVGAGTGATTELVARMLQSQADAGLDLDYLFTDVSQFFLGPARERFGRYPWMRFGVVDIDTSLAAQGLAPGGTDVLIAAGMLNNARDTDATVRDLMKTLAPGGWMLITEPTREHLEILVSQAFMMTPPEDDRQRSDTSFLSVAQWLDVFARAGAGEARVLPAEDHVLAPLGQRLFVVKGN